MILFYFQIWLRNVFNAPTKLSQKRRKMKVKKKRSRKRSFKKYKKDPDPRNIRKLLIEALEDSSQINVIIVHRDKNSEELLPSITPTAVPARDISTTTPSTKYQKQKFEYTNIITDEKEFPDCTLRKWFWACKRFKSWNENIF